MSAVAPEALGAPLALPLAYPVYCQRGALAHIAAVVEAVAPAHRVALITDAHVAMHHAAAVESQFAEGHLRRFTIPAGEAEKTRDRWAQLTDALLAWGAGRDTTVIALGGGVVGDLAGFVAATFMRGLPVVQVPTSLLAMVDASVGGKTAVDTPQGKNLVGAFHDPAAVVIDPDVLRTLSPDQLRAGLAEVLKHGIIADAAYFDATLQALPSLSAEGGAASALPALIAGSVRIKSAVVAEDVREGGLRQILNFGHTIAHAIELLEHYTLLHGDAVAMGMVAEAHLAVRLGLASPTLAVAVEDAVRRAGLPLRPPAHLDPAAIVAATHGDKKARGGAARYALPRAVGEMESGEGRWSVSVPDALVLQVLTGET
ncbi:MAG: 3-dehydroquinate synthase [Gemmatimonadetes bacterium]|nr:3-dehydroquinate synthase [Gemmatimonadota bacterium]